MGEGVPRLPPVELPMGSRDLDGGGDTVDLSNPWTALATLLPLYVRD